MPATVLFDEGAHRNVLLDVDAGALSDLAVSSNQHLIVHGGVGMILDPGGHHVYSRAMAEAFSAMGEGKLRHLFLSHQDPDIVAAINGWLMTTDADAYVSALWTRFVPHFGFDHLLRDRLKPIPDEGMVFDLNGADLLILPAHFLHSVGNFHIYDPTSKVLYSGDLGASMGAPSPVVTDLAEHVRYMEGFHRRYMASTAALRGWVDMVAELDIETIAPQHGARMEGAATVAAFLEWCRSLECGIDAMPGIYKAPSR